MKSPFSTYLTSLAQTRAVTEGTRTKDLEHQHRPALKILLEDLLPEVHAVNEPGKIDFGAPDFALVKNGFPIGYVETKRLGEDLNEIIKTDQLKRYFGYANLVLTNYLEFRFYKHGEEYCEPITIARVSDLVADDSASELLSSTIKAFLEDAAEPVRRAGRLAEIMGEHGKRIRGNLVRFLKTDSEKNKPILDIYEAFKSQLIHDLSVDDFADMYAQTLVYGLFVARYHDESQKDFSRGEARDLIPHTNPLLLRFFDHIAGADFDDRLKPIVDDLCKVFSASDVRALMGQIYKQDLWGAVEAAPDPVIHFYEDFLKAYDPAERKKLGAYYTPPAVVSFIIRSVDAVLKRDFGLAYGLADTKKISVTRTVQAQKKKELIHQVQVLDPATGTGTFLNETVRHIRRSFTGQEGRFAGYVNQDLLPRLHGFELMMAPYTIAHLKLAATLRESGARDVTERIGIYLTNSLEKAEQPADSLFGALGLAKSISQESVAAARIKNETPIMVVVGNPPYAGESSNKKYEEHNVYKIEPGTADKLKEKNSKWINDDYVKFIRLAESLIEKTGDGVIGMITAHGYLDNPTFRGMRYRLMQTMSDIYVIDLHGNANKKEKSPDGTKDENVFAIKQGVAILIAVRKADKPHNTLARIHRADVFGSKKRKIEILNGMDFETLAWQEVEPHAPHYAWVAQDEEARATYEQGFLLNALFRVKNTGVVTKRDFLSIDFDKENLWKKILFFVENSEDKVRSHLKLPKDVRDWRFEWAKNDLLKSGPNKEKIISIAYRPFDLRCTYYTGQSRGFIGWPVPVVSDHYIKGRNIGLLMTKSVRDPYYSHVFVTNTISEVIYLSGTTGTNAINAPLYLYADDGSRVSNLHPDIVAGIATHIGSDPSPEDVFDYVYACLHSPRYRDTYKEFLKTDFPRVPYPRTKDQFDALAGLGRELRNLHLLESPSVRQFVTTYPEAGTDEVEKVRREGDKVYINASQYFGGVPDVAWNFSVGGHLPAQKWLKDRMGRTLASADIEHYQQMIAALVETHRIMQEIDKVSDSA